MSLNDKEYRKNAEGYADPTAYDAIRNIMMDSVRLIFPDLVESVRIVEEQLTRAIKKLNEAVKVVAEAFQAFARQEVVDYLADIDDEPDKDLSPRQYGERLSWGKHGRPYKPWRCSYIPLFKRNLPYQRRNFIS